MKIDLTPYCIGLSLIFLLLDKIFNLGWSWWAITSPIWFPFLLIVIPVGVSMIIFVFVWVFHPEKIKITYKGKEIKK